MINYFKNKYLKVRLVADNKKLTGAVSSQLFPNNVSKVQSSLSFDDNLIRNEYWYYVKNISSEEAAMSFETIALVWYLLNYLKPVSVLDTGSGFSSYLLRYYSQVQKNKNIEVVSVDDNEFWLEKTLKYLNDKGVNNGNLISYHDFSKKKYINHFDFIFHDLGHPREIRISSFESVFQACKSGGIMLVDDIHKDPIKDKIIQYVNDGKLLLQDTTKLTYDHLGRYSWLVKKV